MATNDFLPFATGSGANVLSQADWVALAQRLSGFQSGVAQSAQLNKAWRQSSIMAAVLAQFIADMSGKDALDDGTTATLLANLKAAASASSVGVVGAMRNGRMSVTTASQTATFTADEIIVESVLGGLTYRLANFSKTINLAATGAGGMDTGTAPANGYVALYAIYNPTTGASALVARNATSAIQPEVYGGANMPSGYAASALVGVWPTNASRQFKVGAQLDRLVYFPIVNVLSTSTSTANYTQLSIAGAVPMNAKTIFGDIATQNQTATATQNSLAVACDANGTARQIVFSSNGANVAFNTDVPFGNIPIAVSQTIYYLGTSTAGTPLYTINISGYSF